MAPPVIEPVRSGPVIEPDRSGPVFFLDLASPDCYLVAERILGALPVVAEWQPVVGAELGIAPPPLDVDSLAAAAAAQGLLPFRAPRGWPADTELATLVAVYAKAGGKAVAYCLAAFRQAFAGGNDLGAEATVLLAAAASELHPTAVLKAVGLRSTRAALDAGIARARAAGVTALPAIHAGERVFCGPRALAEAAAALGGARPA